MILEIKKPITKAKIERIKEKLAGVKSVKKAFDPSKYAGKINWGDHAMAVQKMMRDEWE